MKTEPHITPCPKHPESDIYSATKRCVECTAEDLATAPWPIMTRNDAIAKGYRKYWNGKVCGNGHIKQSYSASGVCIGCNSMNSMKHNKKLRKSLADANRGLVHVSLMASPENAEAIKSYAALLEVAP